MKKLFTFLLLLCGTSVLRAQLIPIYGGERAGLSALVFLKNDMSTRSLGMAGASVANDGDAYAFMTNPAAAMQLEGQSWSSGNYFVGGGVNQSWLSGAFPLKDRVSVLGVHLNGLNSGEIIERTEFQPEGTGRSIYVTNLAVGVGYARQLSSLFSVGVNVKYVYEGIAEFTNHTAAVDVSFLYKTDYKKLQFAVMVQNFGGNSSLSGDNLAVAFNRTPGTALEDNTVPTQFQMGVSAVPWESGHHSLRTSLQLNHPSDNAENYRLGVEYDYRKILALRTGIRLNVAGQPYPTFGFSVRSMVGAHPLHIDYAVNPTDLLGFQHHIGLRFTILKNTDR